MVQAIAAADELSWNDAVVNINDLRRKRRKLAIVMSSGRGGTPTPPSASLDFSSASNSMYVVLLRRF